MAERFLHGYPREGKWHQPPLEVVSAYVDQRPEGDLSGKRAEEFGFKIYPTVAEALRCGGDKLAVDAVLLIGEHGDYPVNEIGQKQYPRYELFSQIAKVFKEDGRPRPSSTTSTSRGSSSGPRRWSKRPSAMNSRFLAGSSLPVTWRMPAIDLPYGAEVEEVLGVAFGSRRYLRLSRPGDDPVHGRAPEGGRDGRRQHARPPRRRRLAGAWTAGSWTAGGWSPRLFEACLSRSQTLAQDESPAIAIRRPSRCSEWTKEPVAYRFEYADGLKATMLQLNGLVGDFTFAAKLKSEAEPLSTLFYLPDNPQRRLFRRPDVQSRGDVPHRQSALSRRAARSSPAASPPPACSRSPLGKRLETPHLAKVRYEAPRESQFWRT